MTEEQAQTYAVIVTRIWGTPNRHCNFWQSAERGYFSLKGDIEIEGEGACFEVSNWQGGRAHLWNAREPGVIRYLAKNKIITNSGKITHSGEAESPFIMRGLPFFRRNCWLTGLNVECTVAEVCQCIQTFPLQAARVLERDFKKGEKWNFHQQLEFRLSIPREFWPKRWLDELPST